ncbi:serine hydrolase domain-containing protein [Flindersiella endophytica]
MHSKQNRRAILAAAPLTAAALLAPSLGAGAAHAERSSTSSGKIPDDLRPGGKLDRYIAQRAAEDAFSGTVLVTHRSKTVLERAHGLADKAHKVPNRPDTLFNLGSNTKMFTGVAIGQLAQQGKLRYYETVGTYLDGFAPELADHVTIHQLLTHTSGLGDYHQMDGFFETARTWKSVDEAWNGVLSYVRKEKPTFPPGSGSKYSNSGYVILGAIVAALSGQSYYDYIHEHIFKPAGMKTAAFCTNPQWRTDPMIAHPYTTTPSGEREEALDRHLYVGMPAGGSFSSTRDMARFADALHRDKLLDPPFGYIHLSPKLPPTPESDSGDGFKLGFVGYGILVRLTGGQWIRGHGGGSPGVNANLLWFADSDYVVVIHSNYDDGAKGIGGVAEEIILAAR